MDFWKRPPSWDKDKKEWSYPWPKLFLAAVRVVESEREYWDIQVARIYFGDDEPYLEANGESWALIEDVLWIAEIKEPEATSFTKKPTEEWVSFKRGDFAK